MKRSELYHEEKLDVKENLLLDILRTLEEIKPPEKTLFQRLVE